MSTVADPVKTAAEYWYASSATHVSLFLKRIRIHRSSSARIDSYWTIAAFGVYTLTSCVTCTGDLMFLAAILYYDFGLTIGAEVEYFWKSANLSLVSTLFVINRYYGLLGPLPIIAEYFLDISEHVSTHEPQGKHDSASPSL